MRLHELLQGIYDLPIDEKTAQTEITSISVDSRTVSPGALFIALKGTTYDGSAFIEEAIQKGARVIATDNQNILKVSHGHVGLLHVPTPQEFLVSSIRKFYGRPSQDVRVIGVTGTNGKTTITYMIESILNADDKECGVVGTINYRIGNRLIPSTNTTPGLVDNQKFLFDLKSEGIDYCVMEVSSHALAQGRVNLIDFDTAVFTNLTVDHLDYHGDKSSYFAAKTKLFTDFPSLKSAVINIDDEYGRKIVSMTSANVLTYGIKDHAKVRAVDVQLNMSFTEFKLECEEGTIALRTNFVGLYNVSNALAAAAACLAQGVGLDKIKTGIENLKNVPGRLEKVDFGQEFTILLDYAHTEDALSNVLSTIRYTSDAKIILVFGCGGNRDKSKRPAMAKVASQLTDFSIITSDNPRNEEPEDIIAEIVQGFDGGHYKVIVDRTKAIEEALKMAHKGDIVLIAGKGHETYQIFKDRTIKYDEREVIRQILLC